MKIKWLVSYFTNEVRSLKHSVSQLELEGIEMTGEALIWFS